MIIRKAFKYRLKATEQQKQLFRQQAGCCRFVWNKFLWLQKQMLDSSDGLLNYFDMANLLTTFKHMESNNFLYDVANHPLQQTLMFLDRALKDAFNKKDPKRFPRFKKKNCSIDSFRHPIGFKIDKDKIYIPKIGWIRFIKSREIEGKPKNVTVSRRADHWYVSIQTEIEIADPIHPSKSTIGIDLGVARFATLSDGSYLEPLNSFKKLESKLAKEQRKLSHKIKFSSNWKKQKRKVTKLHIRIADARKDYLHKASTSISKNHAVVVLEDLKVVNMSASATGSIDNPGKNVRAKSGLNKAILDQGWYEFRRQLEYKQLCRGGEVISVPPHYTSQTRPECGHISADNRKSQSSFVCANCGYSENADLVGAINILRAGNARIACEVNGALMPSAAGTCL